MTGFILAILADVFSGSAKQRMDAAAAFSDPPRNPAARRWARLALLLFLMTSALLVTSALIDWQIGDRLICEIFGWSGIVCFQLCVACGLRYAIINNRDGDMPP